MSKIIAKKLILIYKNGHVTDYTHVTDIGLTAGNTQLAVTGETDDMDGSRRNSFDRHLISQLTIGIIEFYNPKE